MSKLDVPSAVSNRLDVANAAYSNGYIYPKNAVLSTTQQQECAILVQALAPNVGGTGSWTAQGPAVGPSNPNLLPGTPIATLENNSYPASGYFNPSLGIEGEAHSAIFLGYIRNETTGEITGMNILDQYDGKPAGVRPRDFTNERYTYYPI